MTCRQGTSDSDKPEIFSLFRVEAKTERPVPAPPDNESLNV